MTAEILKTKTKEEVLDFIRTRLSFDENIIPHLKHIDPNVFKNEHRRFEMSGYETKVGQCTLRNMEILNVFADLGIYDITHYLFLDFYKGSARLYLRYFGDEDNLEFEFTGLGTVEIVYQIFKKTILSYKCRRRRTDNCIDLW